MMLTIDQQANRWVVRLSEHGLDESERAALDAWCAEDVRHHGAFARAMALQHMLDKAATHSPGQASAAAPQPAAPETAPPELDQPQPWRRQFLGFGALAAGLAIVAGITTFSGRPERHGFETALGESRKVPLLDQSIAHINSGSKIEVVITDRARQVHLQRGEVWFDVAKDKARPFVVDAGRAVVRAVGTSFSVRRLGLHGAEVAVTEGTVEIWDDTDKSRKLLLAAGDRAVLPETPGAIRVSKEPEEVARRLGWREGRLIFTNQTLDEAVADFNRYSRRRIVIADPALRGKTLFGRYKVDDPETFARDVSAFLQAPIAVTHEQIIIGDVRLLDRKGKPVHDAG